MKKLFLVATIAIAGITGTVSAQGLGKNVESVKATTCMKAIYDSNGNFMGYIVVPCPSVIVISN
jgi:hypothetical protein